MAGTILVHDADGIRTITIVAPQAKNALTRAMFAQLTEALHSAGAARAVVLTGADGNFCTGADLADPDGAGTGDPLTYMDELSNAARALEAIEVPTIALVEGLCVGAGMSLAMGCDLVVASSSARFCMIFARRGLSIDLGGSTFLVRRVGVAKARELCLRATMVPADEALRIGLCTTVVDDAVFHHEAGQIVREMGHGPTLAFTAIKELTARAAFEDFEAVVHAECVAQIRGFGSHDVAEAISAFFEKRTPNFEGR